jgi:sec-independent protein translocase protein TatA
MGSLGPWEIALIVLAILLVFGPKQLPKVGRSLGRGMREFKDSVSEPAKEIKEAVDMPRELRAALDPRQQLKDAINPFKEDEEEEILEGEIVESPADGVPVADQAPDAASAAVAEAPAEELPVEPPAEKPVAEPAEKS